MKLSGLYTWSTQPLEPSVGGGPSKQDGEVAPLATQLQVCMRTLPTPLAQHLGMTARAHPWTLRFTVGGAA